MSMRRMEGLLFAGGLTAGFGAGMTAIAHASDPVRPAQAWNEIFLPFDNGQGNPLCVAVADGGGTAAGNDQTPLVAASCQGFGNAAEILELG